MYVADKIARVLSLRSYCMSGTPTDPHIHYIARIAYGTANDRPFGDLWTPSV